MVKRICDICRVRESSNRYRMQQRKKLCEFTEHGVFAKSSWVDIDVCEDCMRIFRGEYPTPVEKPAQPEFCPLWEGK